MSDIKIKYGTCIEDAPKVLMSRITGLTATAITQASLNGLSYLVKRYASKADAETDTDGITVVSETSLAPISSYIYNTLQTDNDWTAEGGDSTGYNFKMTLPASAFPTRNEWYREETWCDPTSGDDFPGAICILFCKATARD